MINGVVIKACSHLVKSDQTWACLGQQSPGGGVDTGMGLVGVGWGLDVGVVVPWIQWELIGEVVEGCEWRWIGWLYGVGDVKGCDWGISYQCRYGWW